MQLLTGGHPEARCTAGHVYDGFGDCCESGVIDEGGTLCCDSGILDECGLCDGPGYNEYGCCHGGIGDIYG